MKLNLRLPEIPKHSEVATAVSWTHGDEIISAGDDHQVLRWDLTTNETSTMIELPHDVYPVAMKWPPQGIGGPVANGGRKVNELLLLTSTTGSFYLYGKGNRLEKTVQAHQGAIISTAWSPNGSEILTAGEDGFLRIWSRAGMLRSVVAQHHMALYACTWGPDGRSVLYGLDKTLIIRQTSAGSRPVEWKAHDGLILCVAWSPTVNLIVSGGEDCRYRVWTPDGRCLYTSGNLEVPVTSVAWSLSGELFSIGGSDMIRLCDQYGWTHTVENPKFGSVYAMEWSSDGTQFAGATSVGHVFVANVICRTCVWKNVEATLIAQNVVTICEFKEDTKDRLEFQDRVIQIAMNYGHLLVVLPTQIYIYNVGNIPIHVVCDLKEPNSIYLTLQTKRNFVVCGHNGITSRSYDGRQLTQIKWPGMQSEMLNVRTIAVAEDMVALIDQAERRLIRVYDTLNGRLLTEIHSTTELHQVALAQNEMTGPTERQLAYVDKSFDLFLTLVKRQGKTDVSRRLGSATASILWHTDAPMLASIRESKVRIYYYPQILMVDPTLLEHTVEEKEIGNPGPFPQLVSYVESCIQVQKVDGTQICTTGNMFVSQLYQFTAAGNFGKARRLCRYASVETLWGVLAGMAASRGDLDTAEICFTEIGHFDKVEFLTNSKLIKGDVLGEAQREMFIGGVGKGEEVLMKAGRLPEAIQLNLDSMNWERALELTLKNNEDASQLLQRRQEFLDAFNIEEFLEGFIELSSYVKGKGSKGQSQGAKKTRPVATKSKMEIQEDIELIEED